MNIAVLFGGISPERFVSMNGGKAVVQALRTLGHNVYPIDPALGADCIVDIDNIDIPNRAPTKSEWSNFPLRNLIDCINSSIFDNIEVAFLVLHGINGEDGKIQALLECRGIPYTGSNVKASALSIDKIASKLIFNATGIMTPPWIIARKKEVGNYEFLATVRAELGSKLVVKPNDQGSSVGVKIISDGNLDDINQAMVEALEYSNIALIEQFIEGREITVGIIGEEALPIIEIAPQEGFYDYTNKYTKGKSLYICPADISEDIEEFTKGIAETAFIELGCSGFARADFRLSEEGQPYIMEMNTVPGFTSTSLVPMAAKELGIEFPELCQHILDIAMEKKNEQKI